MVDTRAICSGQKWNAPRRAYTLPLIGLKPEEAIHIAMDCFHGQEHSWTAPPRKDLKKEVLCSPLWTGPGMAMGT